MKKSRVTKHTPRTWSRAGRPVRPYLIDPVTITKCPLAEPPPSIDDDRDDDRDFLLDPIHPHLLALAPGDPETFHQFASELGLHELFDWIGPLGLPLGNPMTQLLERYDSGYRHFKPEALTDAWTDPAVVKAVKAEQALLREAFEMTLLADDAREAAHRILALGWGHGSFQIDLALDETDGVIYEQPLHVWSRAWFELLEGLRGERLPQTCGHCGNPFVPRRRNAAYCTTACQQSAYDKRRGRTPERRKYQREYKRQERERKRSKSSNETKDEGGT